MHSLAHSIVYGQTSLAFTLAVRSCKWRVGRSATATTHTHTTATIHTEEASGQRRYGFLSRRQLLLLLLRLLMMIVEAVVEEAVLYPRLVGDTIPQRVVVATSVFDIAIGRHYRRLLLLPPQQRELQIGILHAEEATRPLRVLLLLLLLLPVTIGSVEKVERDQLALVAEAELDGSGGLGVQEVARHRQLALFDHQAERRRVGGATRPRLGRQAVDNPACHGQDALNCAGAGRHRLEEAEIEQRRPLELSARPSQHTAARHSHVALDLTRVLCASVSDGQQELAHTHVVRGSLCAVSWSLLLLLLLLLLFE